MEKTRLDLMPLLLPTPVVLVTCQGKSSKPNIITIAWTGVVNSKPPMLGISVQPVRYSHELIRSSGQFGVNIPTKEMLKIVDYCGTVSGKKVDKFEKTRLTPFEGEKIKAPMIEECPINLECEVRHFLSLGLHHLFIGEILNIHADKDILIDSRQIDSQRISPIVYFPKPPEYWCLREKIGERGFTKAKI